MSVGLRYEGFLNIRDASDDIMTNLEFHVQDTGNLRSDLATAQHGGAPVLPRRRPLWTARSTPWPRG